MTKRQNIDSSLRKLNDEKAAQDAQSAFENTFQKRETPQDVREIKIESETSIIDLLTKNGIIASASQAKNLVKENAVDIDGKIVESPKEIVRPGQLVKVGKKTFVKTI